MSYPDSFFDALGRWQRGWRRDPVLRGSLATTLVREASRLPNTVRQHDGQALYRKRNLYRREDQAELIPLFMQGVLDEGSPTSWSTSLSFAERFGKIFDDHSPNSVAGAIFRHVPVDDEVVLNIPRLWLDPVFVASADSYRNRGGSEAKAIFHFRGQRDQFEVILRAPLRVDEIYRLGRSTTTEAIYEEIGAKSDDAKNRVDSLLRRTNIDPFDARYLSEEGTHRVVQRVIEKQRNRLNLWRRERTPTRPSKGLGRLEDAFELGKGRARAEAKFEGWRRRRGRGGLMEARWSDGTVAYHGLFGRVWIW
jgi:hypothetical protein